MLLAIHSSSNGLANVIVRGTEFFMTYIGHESYV
jgi:hypothetical protein